MDNSAIRRIRRWDAGQGPGLVFFIIFSIAFHALVMGVVVYFPGLHEKHKAVDIYNISVTSLPPGPAGGGGQAEEVKPPEEEKVEVPPEEEPVQAAKKQVEKKPSETPAKEPKDYVMLDEPRGPGVGPVGGGNVKDPQVVGPITVDGGTDSSLMAAYLKKLQDMVFRRWAVPSLSGRAQPKTVLYFCIDKRGRISDLRVEASSGNVTYDNSTLRVLREIKDLGNMPPDFKGDRLWVHYTFIPESK